MCIPFFEKFKPKLPTWLLVGVTWLDHVIGRIDCRVLRARAGLDDGKRGL